MCLDELREKEILITGGAGFIGSHLSTHLVQTNNVRVLDSFVSGSRSNIPDGVTVIKGDIRDTQTLSTAIEDVDIVFHEAALVSVEQSIQNPLTSHRINVDATQTLFEQARKRNIRVVVASSAAIYGHPDSVPINENHSKQPLSPYGLEKLTIDHYARMYCDLYDLDTVSLRYFNVYGPGQVAGDYSGVISAFIDQALAGNDITVHGTGEQTRDFVYVDDIIQANCKAASTPEIGQSYNIGSGESVTIRELAELIRNITDSSSDIIHTEPRDGDINQSKADISKAKSKLGYEPTVSLREGLKRTVDWYLDKQ